ncbi:stage 0 sporulation family protein [Dehalococcoides mccartyi]|uniref:PSP1-like protein n=1 Tax=Dehalococcoides mccartyi (strain VS) TaxID=311424 RepID=D2BH31_DEHMV|nr:stage 0 sporulation family protein [Dehalococcoides mccartyi]ACZ61631.1 PSP1-like protein [Dehalococcoides mccartyi VS]
MVNIVKIRYKQAGKIYYFDPAGFELYQYDCVVVETSRGEELGWVVASPSQVEESSLEQPLKPVIRLATAEDMARERQLGEKNQSAVTECVELVDKLNLPMKLIRAEYSLDENHVTIYFSAEDRVDFRELVREISRKLRVRVELRQIGPRDEAKMVGGYGRCGRELCCCSFLSEFDPVSIKMAKEQNLPLNPQKISGVCGRLLCCLDYEYETYKAAKAKMPKDGLKVVTPVGKGEVVGGNPLEEMVFVLLESGANAEVALKDIRPDKEGRRPDASLHR